MQLAEHRVKGILHLQAVEECVSSLGGPMALTAQTASCKGDCSTLLACLGMLSTMQLWSQCALANYTGVSQCPFAAGFGL